MDNTTDEWLKVLDGLPVAVLLVADDGRIRYANLEAARITGYPVGDLRDQPVEILVPADEREIHRRHRERAATPPRARPMGSGILVHCRRADGASFPADVSLAPIEIDGRTYTVATVRDDTERRRSEEDLFWRAVHDPLTGLANRALLLDRLEQALARSRRGSGRLAVLYCDLDGFKSVNDRWGHSIGDEVLRLVSQRLVDAVRAEDTVARFGGDEFVILCEQAGDLSEIGQRVLDALTAPVAHAAGVAQLGISVGIAVAGPGSQPAGLIEAADRAMYQAKHAGGNRPSEYCPSAQSETAFGL